MVTFPNHIPVPPTEVPAGSSDGDQPPSAVLGLAVDNIGHNGTAPAAVPRGPISRTGKTRSFRLGDASWMVGTAAWSGPPPTVPAAPPSPPALLDPDTQALWDSLGVSGPLLDEPRHRPAAAVASGERTACPSPSRALQTRALMPDLPLASAALLTLPQGSPAPATPNSKYNFNAATAALNTLWALGDMTPDVEKENLPATHAGPSSTPHELESSEVPSRRRFGRTTTLSSFALAAAGSSPSPSRATTPRPGPRAGLPMTLDSVANDGEPASTLPLSATVAGPSFMAAPLLAAPGFPVGLPVLSSAATGTPQPFGPSAGVGMPDADDGGEEDWSVFLGSEDA